jgi:hypothetical protein
VSEEAMSLHTLYLLPSAPLELAETVYRHVAIELGHDRDEPAVGAALAQLRAAHASGTQGESHDREQTLERRRPWEILHVRPDAPPQILDLAYRYWTERVLGRTVDVMLDPTPPPAGPAHAPPAPPVEVSAYPCLRRPNGDALPLAGRPVRIGGDPTCDFVVPSVAPGTEARVWLNDGRAVLHGLGGDVRVNGAAALWCVLEQADRIAVGREEFVLELR